MHNGKEASWQRKCDALGNVLLGNLGPAIHVDVTYLSIVADHGHSFMETVFPGGCGLFRQDNAPCHKAKMVQEWFEENNNEFEVLTWPPNSPDLYPIEHLWVMLNKQVRPMEVPPRNLQDLQGSSGVHASMGQGCFDSKRGTTQY